MCHHFLPDCYAAVTDRRSLELETCVSIHELAEVEQMREHDMCLLYSPMHAWHREIEGTLLLSWNGFDQMAVCTL